MYDRLILYKLRLVYMFPTAIFVFYLVQLHRWCKAYRHTFVISFFDER